jgi:tRNA dimethylallyltransferase
MTRKPSIIIISGPTGAGKTEVAVSLAEPIGGEIISADAMQVYRHMDVGTAKPSAEQVSRVRHHLIDVVDPDESFSAAVFRTMAERVILDLHNKGVPVFVVGGTGLYIKALTRGLFKISAEDHAVRERLRREVRNRGAQALHGRLKDLDPESAARIHPNDTYRIMRAIEVFELTGRSISEHHGAHDFSDNPYRVLKFGLFINREILYDRIDKRADRMIAAGLLEEVQGLLDRGYAPGLKAMQSIGYRHMAAYLLDELDWDETVRRFKRDTRRYAKRQLTWLRKDPDIHWVQPGERALMEKKTDAFLTGLA